MVYDENNLFGIKNADGSWSGIIGMLIEEVSFVGDNLKLLNVVYNSGKKAY